MKLCLCILAIASLTACGNSGGDQLPSDGGGLYDGDGSLIVDDSGLPLHCEAGQEICLDYKTRRACQDGSWVNEICSDGSGCVAGACVVSACSDECDLGTTDGSRNCELFDIGSGSFVSPDPAGSMHDRARSFNQWLRRDSLAFGGVGAARYSDPPTYSNVVAWGGLGDSAIWTGTYLAAEALRLQATGASDARENITDLIDTLHLWFNVSGDPGTLARFVAPSDAPASPSLGDLDCSSRRGHCDVPFEGQQYDYIGHISRDQYQGVLFGYSLAYEALSVSDEAARELIREDVVEFIEELMKERSLPFHIDFNGTDLGVFTLDARFIVLSAREMDEGAVSLTIDTSNPDDSEMYGFQEFMPDIAVLLRQLPLLASLPDIPRPGSAIMLASAFQVALQVTDGVPAYASRRAAILDYYLNSSTEGGSISDWLAVADDWEYHGECGAKYYANNIVMEPMYNLARLEDDPGRSALIRDDILDAQMWTEFHNDKNVFFSYSYAANTPSSPASIVSDANAQLAGFPAPPRSWAGVDLRSDPRYMPHQADCTDQVSHDSAVDVADRVVSDFIWQRNPWQLYAPDYPASTGPGVDYLLAYWMGRRHDFLSDDNAGTCLVWRN